MELYLWIMLVVPVCTTRTSNEVTNGCFYKYNRDDCVYYFTCIEDTNIYIDSFDKPSYEPVCIDNGYREYVPIHVDFRRQKYNDDNYRIIWRNSYITAKAIDVLNLSNNRFKQVPELDSMPNLRSLNISRNSLTVAKLSNAKEYQNLEEIDFSYNKIMLLKFDDADYVYKYLTVLDLSHNAIDIIPEGFFITFPKIKYINLSYNHLTYLNQASFEGIINLLGLKIDHNDIIDINSALLNFNNLQVLSMKDNRIEEVLTRDFHNLTKLVELDLSSNDISYIDIHAFDNMKLMQKLNLSDNYIDNIHEIFFSNDLDSVDLSSNKLRHLPTELLSGRNLSVFSIQNNNLEGELKRGMFLGLNRVVSLNISNQFLTSIGDYAFIGLNNLENLMLNKNKISSLSQKAFRSLNNLKLLDLSNNFLANFNFQMHDLVNLQLFSLRYNLITNFEEDDYEHLSSLKVFDLSHNIVTVIGKKIFKDLVMLEKLKFTSDFSLLYSEAFFDRNSSLTDIDVSYSRLLLVRNYTFKNMNKLEIINMSYCFIEEIEFNAFTYTGSVSTLDLSYNKLTNFAIETKGLQELKILLLNSNPFKVITDTTFRNLPLLRELNLSRNLLEGIHEEAFKEQTSLTNLDISFNNFITINIHFLNALHNLTRINLSGLSADVQFPVTKNNRLKELHMSHARVQYVTGLGVGNFKRLENLTLSNNYLAAINKDDFSKATRLRYLDISFNSITYIQPGTFLKNVHLKTLNVTHNLLTTFEFGTFRGLIRLNTLDVSYNRLNGLEMDVLNEMENLESLMIDGNELHNINYIDFLKTPITTVSIGENVIPCNTILKLSQYENVVITAKKLNEYKQNVNGITCY